jgi:hypothetical protein
MATKIYETIEIELENGKTVLIKPLPIKSLRKFMDIIGGASAENLETENDLMDVFIEACIHCLKSLHPKMFAEMTDEEIEDLVTLPTVMKVLEVAGGLKTADPNLLGAAEQSGMI